MVRVEPALPNCVLRIVLMSTEAMSNVPGLGDLILHLTREYALEHTTIGKLFIDGGFLWFTIEDAIPKDGIKIPGLTCIPAGTYQILITESARFGRPLPLLLNVPGFTGIRLHPGNTNADTAGCILPCGGVNIKAGFGLHSAYACAQVQAAIQAALDAGKKVWITIVDPPAVPTARVMLV